MNNYHVKSDIRLIIDGVSELQMTQRWYHNIWKYLMRSLQRLSQTHYTRLLHQDCGIFIVFEWQYKAIQHWGLVYLFKKHKTVLELPGHH